MASWVKVASLVLIERAGIAVGVHERPCWTRNFVQAHASVAATLFSR